MTKISSPQKKSKMGQQTRRERVEEARAGEKAKAKERAVGGERAKGGVGVGVGQVGPKMMQRKSLLRKSLLSFLGRQGGLGSECKVAVSKHDSACCTMYCQVDIASNCKEVEL